MRAVFGVISLLVVLAVVGLLASRQLRTAGLAGAVQPHAGGAAASAATPREQARQVQQQVAADVAKALEQGTAARRDDADK